LNAAAARGQSPGLFFSLDRNLTFAEASRRRSNQKPQTRKTDTDMMTMENETVARRSLLWGRRPTNPIGVLHKSGEKVRMKVDRKMRSACWSFDHAAKSTS